MSRFIVAFWVESWDVTPEIYGWFKDRAEATRWMESTPAHSMIQSGSARGETLQVVEVTGANYASTCWLKMGDERVEGASTVPQVNWSRVELTSRDRPNRTRVYGWQ